MSYSKEKAIEILVKAARDYKTYLDDKNILFVLQNPDTKKHRFFETKFEGGNFLHLTGMKGNAAYFYEKCLNHKLSKKDVIYKDNNTELKLKALENNFFTSVLTARKMGDYNYSLPKLITNEIIRIWGSVLGIYRGGNNDYYHPNTCLYGDHKQWCNQTETIIAIFEKEKRDKQYMQQYLDASTKLQDIPFPESIRNRIDFKE